MENNIVKVVSFDLEGTLVNHDFSDFVWNEGIPELYAKKRGLDLSEAKKFVLSEYAKVGEEKIEWYDIKYWFNRFGLGDYQELFKKYSHKVSYYPEVEDVLKSLSMDYTLVLTTNSAREFLDFLTGKIRKYFSQTFSATSDFKCLKKDNGFYQKICNILNVKPEFVAHIGDRWEDDFVVPRKIGIRAFHLDRSGKTIHRFTVKNLKEFELKIREVKV